MRRAVGTHERQATQGGRSPGNVFAEWTAEFDGPRTHLWIKSTCKQRDAIHIVSWAQKAGKFHGLYLGRKERRRIVFAGKLERCFTDADKKHTFSPSLRN